MIPFLHPGRWFVLVLVVLVLPGLVHAEVTYLGEAVMAGNSKDLSGQKGKLRDGTPANQLGGHGSGIAHTGQGNRYLMVADRGPKDGASNYRCRFHVVEIIVKPGSKSPVQAKLVATRLLTNEKGKPLVGALEALDVRDRTKSLRLDPEGIRVGRKGTVFISDEYGPSISEFSMSGKRLRTLAIPARFFPARYAKLPADELPPKNTRGRQPNRGLEGLAISPDGGKVFALLQSPLIQDGALDKTNKRAGINTRLLEVALATGKTREFVYQLDSPALGLSEILAVDATRFLVVERDGAGGKEARMKKIYLADLKEATDVSAVASLPKTKLPGKIKAASKTLFLDLLAPRFKLAGASFPAKVEGLAFGPDLPDGRHLLLVTTDNDFLAKEPTRILAFAIDKADLAGYQAQQFDKGK